MKKKILKTIFELIVVYYFLSLLFSNTKIVIIFLFIQQVSWMRSRDLHILTTGNLKYISDKRFKLQHLNGSDAWTLQLDHVSKSDAGRYECQLNTEPKRMHVVQLSVRGNGEQPS